MYGYQWRPYVPVGQKKANARNYAAKVAKKQKRTCQPVQIVGRKIAKSFWGHAWCDHLESLSDYANRLPRGRTYVRNGSVVDLVITPGQVKAVVAGSEPYNICISIKKLDKKTWESIKKDCSQSIDSLLDLLGGRLSDGVMQRLTDKKSGCFPVARQIEMNCDCPDWSDCCKHLAAVMYAIGSRLDSEPELLFLLRGVNQEELISQAVSRENLTRELHAASNELAGEDLGAIFGIELDSDPDSKAVQDKAVKESNAKRGKPGRETGTPSGPRAKRTCVEKSTAKQSAVKKSATKKASPKTAIARKKTVKKKAAKKTTVKRKTTETRKATKNKAVSTSKVTKAKKTSKKKRAATTIATRKKRSSTKSATSKKKSVQANQRAKTN